MRVLCGATSADAAAVLIPDHMHRIGTCGLAGPACVWDCQDNAGACEANGPSCAAPGTTCALDATAAFRGVVTVRIDDTACGAGSGSVLTIGLAGTTSNGMQFQVPDKVIDLCDVSMECTGRDARDCADCPAVCSDQCTNDVDCDCPPGPVVFLCKDPFFSPDGFLHEADMPFVVNWLAGIGGSQTRQPLMELIRNDLAAVFPGVSGRPVIVDASTQSLDDFGDPPSGRFCVKVWFLRGNTPLGRCADDPSQPCNASADCDTGACETWTPPGINPTEFTTLASGRVCSDNGKPCVSADDCTSGETCDDTTASADAGSACSVSGTACTSPADCTAEETCVTCRTTLCGDAQVDPGEQCDDGNTLPDDGCSATCQLEGCPTAPDPACQAGFAKGVLAVSEKTPGREKLVARLLNGPLLAPADFGDPVSGGTAYRLCVYDEAGVLAQGFDVDRAGDTCDGAACWRGLGKPAAGKGYRYKDPALSAGGVRLMLLRAGSAGRSKVIVRQKGATGIAADLAGAPSATVQLFASGAPAPACFSIDLPNVTKNDGVRFTAKTP